MKVCASCYKVYPDDLDDCPNCGEKAYYDLNMTPFWDSIEEYQKEDRDASRF